MIRCLHYPKVSTILFLRLPVPKESIIRLVFFQYSGRERFLCTSGGDTELGNIPRKQNKVGNMTWRHSPKVGDTYRLDSIGCFTSFKVHRYIFVHRKVANF